MSYQHGAYGEIGNDKVKSAVQVDTVVRTSEPHLLTLF